MTGCLTSPCAFSEDKKIITVIDKTDGCPCECCNAFECTCELVTSGFSQITFLDPTLTTALSV